jgi:hypothetical protein
MPGGVMSIAANKNDRTNNSQILIGNPGKTFFKSCYSKYLDFSLQRFRLDFEGQKEINLTTSSTFQFKVKRYGDLLMDTFLVLTLPSIYSPIYHPCPQTGNVWSPYEFKWITNIGSLIIKEISISSGGSTIQKYSGEYLMNTVDRDFSAEKKELFNRMTGNISELNDPANAFGRFNTYPNSYYTENMVGSQPSINGRQLYIPLNFWFSNDNRLALPLVALQYNEIIITVSLRPIQELFQVRDVFDTANNNPYIQPDFNADQFQLYRFLQTPPKYDISSYNYQNQVSSFNADVHLVATYVFLSKEEREWFSSQSHVYLVKDILQYNFLNITGTQRLKLMSSNGMVSGWMFYFQRNDANLRNEWDNYTNWPYKNIPDDIKESPLTDINNPTNLGPFVNPNGFTTGFYITGDLNIDNVKNILVSFGVVLDGDYRENTLPAGVFSYIEKYKRTKSGSKDGLYIYSYSLNTDIFDYQPSGAINMSNFKNIQLEITTIVPKVSENNANYNVICDLCGNAIGINKTNWKLYNYNYNCVIFEERYNVLSIVDGTVGMQYAL